MKKLTNLSEFINSNAISLIKGGDVNIGGIRYYAADCKTLIKVENNRTFEAINGQWVETDC